MKESTFSKQIRDDIEEYFDYKDEDIHMYLIQDMKRTGKKPYDFYLFYGAMFYAFELKVCNSNSFPIKNVKPHQPEILKEVIRAGGLGVFIICFPKNKKLFIVTPRQWTKIIIKLKRKSVTFDYFRNECYEINRKKIRGKLRWDIEEIMNLI